MEVLQELYSRFPTCPEEHILQLVEILKGETISTIANILHEDGFLEENVDDIKLPPSKAKKPRKTTNYRTEAKNELYFRFDNISKATIDQIFKDKQQDFIRAFVELSQPETKKMNKTATRTSAILTDPFLIEQISLLEADEPKSAEKVERNIEIECNCCFDGVDEKQVVRCDKNHPICIACLRKYVEESVFGSLDSKLHCPGTDCDETFSHKHLKVLSVELREKFDKRQLEKGLNKIEGLTKCPFCDFVMILEGSEQTSFFCLNPQCWKVSCLKCKLAIHHNKSCEQAEKDGKKKMTIDEKKSEALIRKCPGCQVPFILNDGCCHITCPKCPTHSCYLCNEVLPKQEAYSHFCDHPMASGDGTVRKKPVKSVKGSAHYTLTFKNI